MARKKIFTYFEPVLRKKAKEVSCVDQRYDALIEDMIETMHAACGVGLAAPQVGESIQLIVCNATGKKGDDLVLFNPKVVESKGKLVFEEGCLSIPGLNAKVKRPKQIKVEAYNRQGRQCTLQAEGILARILLHEIDHLNGILFVDRLPFLQKRTMLKAMRTKAKKQCLAL